MFAINWRGALFAGLGLAVFTVPLGAQDRTVLSLEDALVRAGVAQSPAGPATNPRLVGPQAETEAARALIDQARLRPNPEVSFEAENFAGSGAYSGLSATEYTLSFGQRLELSGQRGARIRSAEAEARVTALQGDLSVNGLARSVRERYVEASAAAARLDLSRDIVARNRELTRIAGALVEVGREPPLRALRAQSTLAEALAELEAAQADDLAARTALASLWGDSGAPPEVSAAFPAITPPAELMAMDTALPLRIAQAQREAAEAQIGREQSLARLDPVVSAGVRRFEESNDNAFLVGVTVPLPFGNRNQGNIAAARARLRAATAQEAIVRSDFELAVAQTRSRLLAAEIRVETLSQTSLPQAEEALRLVQIGYSNGRFPLIEVLAAAEARDNIREAVIRAQEDRGLLASQLIWLATQ
jgi:cobalt-zinc-cadmium efflux system outer membrane protein